MQLEGHIVKVFDTQVVGTNNFKKRDLVIKTDEQYPQTIIVQFIQDKCDTLDNFQIGNHVKISINIRGREWVNPEGETKYFNTVQGWRIEYASNNSQQPQQQAQKTPPPQQEDLIDDGEPDDLPF